MDVPVIVGSRLRYRIHWRFLRLHAREDGYEVGIWGHPALRVAMTPDGFEFSQIDWYSGTISYKRRCLLQTGRDEIEPARLLFGLASGRLGFVYLGIYLSDWGRMLHQGQLPLEVGRLGLNPERYRDVRPAAGQPPVPSTRP